MKIVIATGGTLGHIYPAIYLAEELQENGHECIFIGTFNNGTNKINDKAFRLIKIRTQGFNFRRPVQCIKSLYLTVKALIVSCKIIKELKPDVVVGFGGYSSFPVVLASHLLGCATMIHEQNVIPGRVNKLASKVVDKVAISFKDTEKCFKKSNIVLTGCPTRIIDKSVDKNAIFDEFNLDRNKKTILVFGGSQGSHKINQEFLKTLKIIKDNLDLQIIHVCGRCDYHLLESEYSKLGIPFALYEFLDKIDKAYLISDLVISRAGALTVSEIATMKIPAILIPYPYAGNHQRDNAVVLEKSGLAKIIDEKDLNPEIFASEIYECFNNMSGFKSNLNMECVIVEDASRKLAKEVVSLKL